MLQILTKKKEMRFIWTHQKQLIKFSKIPVYEKELFGGLDGYYSSAKEEIVLNKTLSTDDKVAVLLHELAHGLYDDFDYMTNYEAETFNIGGEEDSRRKKKTNIWIKKI